MICRNLEAVHLGLYIIFSDTFIHFPSTDNASLRPPNAVQAGIALSAAKGEKPPSFHITFYQGYTISTQVVSTRPRTTTALFKELGLATSQTGGDIIVSDVMLNDKSIDVWYLLNAQV
ncbi:hypothetical protein C8Q76DRAFT_789424 [Earliella scabrosa]|nr:hypothetical protein C8Q76DRAFT_789424 [Earliella scabrosa]